MRKSGENAVPYVNPSPIAEKCWNVKTWRNSVEKRAKTANPPHAVFSAREGFEVYNWWRECSGFLKLLRTLPTFIIYCKFTGYENYLLSHI